MMLVSLSPTAAGLWDIRRSNVTLFHDLPLAGAIRLARERARDEHMRCGREISVEMPCTGGPIRLALYERRMLDGAGGLQGGAALM